MDKVGGGEIRLMSTKVYDSQHTLGQTELIGDYSSSVLRQANQSFKAALGAAIAGLIFFMAAVTFELFRQPTNVSIIGVISGAVMEFISATNFYLYWRTANQLVVFNSHLDSMQRYLLSNSMCESLEASDVRDQTRAELVRAIASSTAKLPREEMV